MGWLILDDDMSWKTIRRQDESGKHGPGLGVFGAGVLVAKVDERADPDGRLTLAECQRTAYDRAVADGLEVLLICHLHHWQSAVDCEDCEPTESGD